MLAVKAYPKADVEQCRNEFDTIVKGLAAVDNFSNDMKSRMFNEFDLAVDISDVTGCTANRAAPAIC